MFEGIKPGYADKPHATSPVSILCDPSPCMNLEFTPKIDGADFPFLASHFS